MKPIKPKKMTKALATTMKRIAEGPPTRSSISRAAVRTILAALEYERQRADVALDHIAQHAMDFGGTPRGEMFNEFLVKNGRPRAALTWREIEDQKKETT